MVSACVIKTFSVSERAAGNNEASFVRYRGKLRTKSKKKRCARLEILQAGYKIYKENIDFYIANLRIVPNFRTMCACVLPPSKGDEETTISWWSALCTPFPPSYLLGNCGRERG